MALHVLLGFSEKRYSHSFACIFHASSLLTGDFLEHNNRFYLFILHLLYIFHGCMFRIL